MFFILRVIQALESHKVQYAIVGGYAVALHGAIRGTVDLDLVIALTEKQFSEVEGVLKSLGLEPRLPVNGKQIFQYREEYIKNRNLIAWSFYNPAKPIETVDVIITEDCRKFKIKRVSFHGTALRVASIPDLIQMKSKSNRPQDQADIDALRKLTENHE